MSKLLITLLLYLICTALGAQPVSGHYRDLLPYGRLSHTTAFPANQAALADAHQFSLAVYGEQRFLLRPLAWYDLVATVPVSGGAFGLQAVYMGSALQRHTKLALAYARQLNGVALGLQFNRHTIETKGYGHTSFLSVEGGLLLRLSSALHAGLHVSHMAGPPELIYKMPAAFSAGLGYEASPHFFIGACFFKTEDRDAELQLGFEYLLHPLVTVRAGLLTSTPLYYTGISLLLNDFRLDVNASLHPQLGLTPGIGLLYPSIHKE